MTNERQHGQDRAQPRAFAYFYPRFVSSFLPPSPMAPSVRVKRRHAYASILDEDRHRPEQPRDDQIEGGRQTLSEAAATMPSPGSVASPGSPDSTTHLSPNIPNPRSNTSRVNRVVRSSMSYRSFSTDPDSNSPPPTFGRANLPPVPQGTIFGGASADVVVPAPHHHGHAPRTSRVRSALSSSPSRSGPDSDSDSDSDSDDEDRVMEDNEHHHDDDVVDHLDVIGLPSHVLSTFGSLTFFPLQTPKLPPLPP
jgi:hypothetical protein